MIIFPKAYTLHLFESKMKQQGDRHRNEEWQGTVEQVAGGQEMGIGMGGARGRGLATYSPLIPASPAAVPATAKVGGD